MIDYYENRMNLVLPAAGLLGYYYFGAVSVLTQVWPVHPFERIWGCSSGATSAVLYLSGAHIPSAAEEIRRVLTNETMTTWSFFRSKCLVDEIRKLLERIVPLNAHELINGRIGISMTRLSDFSNICATHFNSRSDLIEACVASTFIPLWSGKLMPPRYLGQKCLDGALTGNVPKLHFDHDVDKESASTVMVCPFNIESGVCPEVTSKGLGVWRSAGGLCLNYYNLLRCVPALIPQTRPDTDQMLIEGHNDMKRYLISENLLKCKQCHEEEELQHQQQQQEEQKQLAAARHKTCLRCLLLMEKVDNLKVPKDMLSNR